MKFLQAHPKLAHRPSLVALPDCLLAKPLFYPPIIYRGEREEGEGGSTKEEGAQPAIALSAVFAPNGAACREAPLEDRAGSARRDQ